VEEELVNALQGLIKRFDDRCVTILKHFLFLVHQMLYVIARICWMHSVFEFVSM
jgi:hypothetical protein